MDFYNIHGFFSFEGCIMFTGNVITNRNNRRIVEARKLHQKKYRRYQGRFIVEGYQLLNMALDAGLQPIEVFCCEKQYDDIKIQILLERLRRADTEIVFVLPYIMETLSDHGNPESIISTFTSFEIPLQNIDLNIGRLIIVVDRPQSPANLGMIFRTADAIGATAIIIVLPGVDPLHPKSVRESLGTVFNLQFAQTLDIPAIFTLLHQKGFKPIGTDPSIGTWNQDLLKGKIALILGSDVHGMSDDMRSWVKDWLRLPMIGRVESLSSAVAGSILMYDWFRINYNCKISN